MNDPRLFEYEKNFKLAVKESYAKYWIIRPSIKLSSLHKVDESFLNSHVQNFLKSEMLPALQVSAGQCLKWSYFLQNVVEVGLMKKCWITLGQLWDGENYLYNPSVEQVHSWVENGIHIEDMQNQGTLNFHAWLTSEDGNIIDLTFLSTMANVIGREWSELNGKILIGYQNDFFPHHRYVPMLVGSRAIDEIHKKSSIPLLATTSAELHPTVVHLIGNYRC